MLYIDIYRKKRRRVFLSGAAGPPRALVFGMKLHLVDFYQVCSNYNPGAKNGPAPGVTCFT